MDVLFRCVHEIPQAARFRPQSLENATAHHGLDGVQAVNIRLAPAIPAQLVRITSRVEIGRRGSRDHANGFNQIRAVDGARFASLLIQIG